METVDQIATGIATLCRQGRFLDAVERYYSPSIVSIEAVDFGLGREQRGIEAIRHKHAFWEQHNETHSVSVRGPYLGTGPAANQFALHFLFDITRKATAVRGPLSEVALYTVVNGKIAHEEFFYPSA
jgi:hypothetical protein